METLWYTLAVLFVIGYAVDMWRSRLDRTKLLLINETLDALVKTNTVLIETGDVRSQRIDVTNERVDITINRIERIEQQLLNGNLHGTLPSDN